MNVFSRACGCTGVAAKTLAGPAGVSVNIQMRRASFFAEATFRWAFFTVSLKKCSRQDRHQSKQRSHRAEKLAEKTLLCTHSHHDQDQQDNSTRYLLFGSRPAVIMEKTSHGLVPVSFPYILVRQESRIRASTIYFTF